MSELPKGWVATQIALIAKVESGVGFPKKYQGLDFVDIPVYKVGDISRSVQNQEKSLVRSSNYVDEKTRIAMNAKIYPEGSTLFAKIGEALKLNRRGFVGKEGIADNNVMGVIPDTQLISAKFIFYFLKTVDLSEFSRSSTVPSIRKGDVENLVLCLAPLAEQKRIVAKLDEVLAQVDTIKARLDRIPAILKRFRQSVLAAAVSGKLTEEWRGAADDFNSNNKLIPSSWEIRAAKDICVTVQSGSTPQNDPFNQNGTIPFLKVYNIVNQQIDFDYKPQFITHETHSKKLKRSVAYPGDILMNIVGPPLGKVAILTEQYPEWNLNQAITLFRVNEDILLNRYLYFVLCEGELVRAVMPETKGSVGQVNISLSQCRDSLIPLPPKEEQKEIVRLVDQYFAFADTIEAQVKKAQARVDNLTQSILAKAFRGELVAQDPNDEPADKLLERIAKARTEAEQLAKAAKKAVKSQR
ncbi:restriction endonuclease subunit S [Vibrio metschnikovii]|uniref:restriction endonuclease subunit S n=1 Tax=Vibrio metschnikovii TaxID=28172 RepID=UPI001C303C0C|nr:restriction endonuclease subunit S [Vibrio metschnikovii]